MTHRFARPRYFLIGFLVLLACLLVADPAFAAQEPLIVGVTNITHAIAELQALGIPIRHVIDVSNALAVGGDPEHLRTLPFVRYVEPDPPDAVWTQEDTLPYGVNNIDAEVVWGGSQGATNVILGQGGLGSRVAVVDTGIACDHPDLTTGCLYGANFVSTALPYDDHGHGTHVAGIVGARDNGYGVIGVAPEAELYAVKVLNSAGSGSWSAVASGINWPVLNGMNVINMSLGGTVGSQAVADAVVAADAAGLLVVSAAGNSGCCNTVLYPAKYAGSRAIAAVDQLDQWASFSSTGPEVDVAAPGVSVLSTVSTGTCSLCDSSGYRYLSGTSMATPHAAGVGALLMSRGFTKADAWSLITNTAKDLGTTGFDEYFGWGRVDALASAATPSAERHDAAHHLHHEPGERHDGRQAFHRDDPGQRLGRRGDGAGGVLRQRRPEVLSEREPLYLRLESPGRNRQVLSAPVPGLRRRRQPRPLSPRHHDEPVTPRPR